MLMMTMMMVTVKIHYCIFAYSFLSNLIIFRKCVFKLFSFILPPVTLLETYNCPPVKPLINLLRKKLQNKYISFSDTQG